jgi:hypothetical protein
VISRSKNVVIFHSRHIHSTFSFFAAITMWFKGWYRNRQGVHGPNILCFSFQLTVRFHSIPWDGNLVDRPEIQMIANLGARILLISHLTASCRGNPIEPRSQKSKASIDLHETGALG